MKRAQMMEFIGIMVLIAVIVVFSMLSRISASSIYVEQSEQTLREYQANRFLLASKIFPYITVKNIPMEQLLGVYVCYGNQTFNYGLGKIDAIKEVRSLLNQTIESDMWKLQIGDNDIESTNICISSKSLDHDRCRFSPNKKIMSQEFVFTLPCRPSIEHATIFFERY